MKSKKKMKAPKLTKAEIALILGDSDAMERRVNTLERRVALMEAVIEPIRRELMLKKLGDEVCWQVAQEEAPRALDYGCDHGTSCTTPPIQIKVPRRRERK
jgi:hypothetical protein